MIGDFRSYGNLALVALFVGTGATAWNLDTEPAKDGQTAVELDQRGPAMTVRAGALAACETRTPPANEVERRDAPPTEPEPRRMTKDPNYDEGETDFAWEGDLHLGTALRLELDAPTRDIDETPSSSKDRRVRMEAPILDQTLAVDGPLDPWATSGAEIGSIPELPEHPETNSSESDVDERIDRIARSASRTLNSIDRLGRQVMDGARLPSPTRLRSSSRQPPGGPQAKVAPNWIRGSPGARLEISF